MGSLRALTLWLVLLLLVPAAALAVLGWRSLGDADAVLSIRARMDLDSAEGFLRTGVLRAAESWQRHLQQAAAEAAERVRSEAPHGDLPASLAAAERHLVERRLRIPSALRLVDANGRGILPAEADPDGAAPASDERERFFHGLRARAEAAWFGRGDLAAALTVYAEAEPRALRPAARARLDVERARVALAASGGAGDAQEIYARVVEAWDGPRLGEVGRPWILLAAACAERGVARARRDLASAQGSGLLARTPLDPVERARVLRLLGGGAPAADVVRASAEVAAGARLEVAVPASFLWGDLQAGARAEAARGVGPWNVALDLGPSQGAFPSSSFRFGIEWRRVVVFPLPGEREASLALVHPQAISWGDQWQTRRAWTFVGIAALLGTVLLGVGVLRRALLRERAARRLRDDFVANVSHELRTPLTSVCLHAEMLAEDDVPAERRRAHAGVVRAEGGRLMALVEEMLDFAALERGARRLEPEPVDLGAAVRHAVAPYATLAEREGVALAVDVPAEGPFALVDRAAVGRILANLLANAWKHGRPSRDGAPGRIEVRAEGTSGGVRVCVRDDGPGVAAADLPFLFERFRRGADAGARPGVGLGLAIARDLARRSGGDLTYGGEGPGAAFRLDLPAAPESAP